MCAYEYVVSLCKVYTQGCKSGVILTETSSIELLTTFYRIIKTKWHKYTYHCMHNNQYL